MANLIVVCTRNAKEDHWVADVRRVADALVPDNIVADPPLVQERDGVVVAVVNPVAGIPVHDDAVCLGRMCRPCGSWWQTTSPVPDGTFVLVRHDQERVELLTDLLATRPTWYYQTDRVFMASTSQRALVALLGSFVPDEESLTWMLTSGHLASRSWDARLRRLPGDCRLTLDRASWKLTLDIGEYRREPLALSDGEHRDRLRTAIKDACAALDLSEEEWVLPLSGGMDSRVLLLGLLAAGKRPKCVTWGAEASLQDPQSDASIATSLAAALDVQHDYHCLEGEATPIDVALQRFLAAGEGQVEDFGGYADGMAIWAKLFEEGFSGVVRGDEPAMGYYTRYDSELQILRRWGIAFLHEFPADHAVSSLGLVEQQRTELFLRREGETLTGYYARLFDQLSAPSRITTLSCIKSPYLEVVNPMQTRRVADVVRAFPDHLFIHRRPLHDIVLADGPAVPLATEGALRALEGAQREALRATVARTLEADAAERVLSRLALDRIVAGMPSGGRAEEADRSFDLRHAVGKLVPRVVIDRIRPVWPLRLSGEHLAFRAFIAVRMDEILRSDAGSLAAGKRA